MGKMRLLKSKNIFIEKDKVIDGFVVIKGNRIYDVQPITNIAKYSNDEVEVVDYGDKTIMPAFNDAHVHLLLAAIADKGGFLRYCNSEQEAVELFYENNKDRDSKFLIGGAWDHFRWPGQKEPTKKSLDEKFPDKMVFLLNREVHGAWCNSKCLEYFGIDKNTPDPQSGVIYRDEKGEPTGYLHEFAAYNMLQDILSEMSNDEIAEYVQAFTKTAYASGVTSVADVQVGNVCTYEVYEEMESRGELGLRVHYSPSIELDNDELIRIQKEDRGDRLKFSGVKAFADGTAAGHTALMISEYLDDPGNVGIPSIDLDYLKDRVLELDAMGIRTRIHACGDLSVQLSLDYFENARRINGSMGTRHTIEHIEVAAPEDLPRFGALDVIASVQPNHMPRDGYYEHPFHASLGEERMKYSWPFNTILKEGGRMAFGTDYSCVPIAPFATIQRAQTRLSDQLEPPGGFNPWEKIELMDVLDIYTAGSAYCTYRENELGKLKIGYLADIVVLSDNIFEIDVMDTVNLEVEATYFDGEKVYEAVGC